MKKLLAVLLALVMVFALCACGKSAAPAAEAPAAAAEAPAAEAPAEAATGSLKVWAPEATVEFTKEQIEAYLASLPAAE